MDGEFERLVTWVGMQGLRALAGAFLVGIPVTALALVGWAHRLPRLRPYWHVPIVTRPAAAAGVLLGWSVLYADPLSPSFRIWSIFEVGGPWDLPWTFFLRYRADPGLYHLETLVPFIREPDLDPALALVLLAVGILLVIAVAATLVYLRGIDVVVGLFGVAFLLLFAQAMTIYVTALTAYTFNTLNFWAAAVALVILQYYRRIAHPKVH